MVPLTLFTQERFWDVLTNALRAPVDGQPQKASHKWGTIRNYMNTSYKFGQFILQQRVVSAPSGTNSLNGWFTEFESKYRGSLESIKKYLSREHHLKQAKSEERLLTQQELEEYYSSAWRRITMARCLTGQEPFTKLRAFIALELVLANAKRSGVLAGLTWRDFQAMKHRPDFDSNANGTMSVCRHKTSSTYGASHIVVTPEMYNLLSALEDEHQYMARTTSNFSKYQEVTGGPYVFATSNGNKSENTDINRYINEAFASFRAAERLPEKTTTSTIIRKSIVTLFYASCTTQTERERFASHMDHSVATAMRYVGPLT